MEAELLQYQEILARCSCCRPEGVAAVDDGRNGDAAATAAAAAATHPSPLRHEHVRAAAGHHPQAPVEHSAAERRRIRKKQPQETDPEGDEF